MALGPREKRLLKQLVDKGLLNTPEIKLLDIPAYKPPKLPTKLKMAPLSAPAQINQQDASNYMLLHTSGNKQVAKMFGDSLSTREGAEHEQQSILGKLFDVLMIPNYTMAGIGDAIAEGMDTEDSFLENVGDVVSGTGKSLAGGALRLADATVMNPLEAIPFGVGDKLTNTLKETEEQLLPRKTFRDVIKENPNIFGIENNAAQSWLGFGLDVATDPTTYLGFGLANKFGRAALNPTRVLDERAAGVPEAFMKPNVTGYASDGIQTVRRGTYRRGHKKADISIPRAQYGINNEGLADTAISRNMIPNLNRNSVPQLKRQQVGTPLMDEAIQAITQSPLSRGLKRRLEKAQKDGFGGGLTKGQAAAARSQEIPNPTRTITQKIERANDDFSRAMLKSGLAAEKGTLLSVKAANEIAARIAKGELPRAIPVPKASIEDAATARSVADNMIDDVLGSNKSKRNLVQFRGNLAGLGIRHFTPKEQITLFSKVALATGKGLDEGVIPALKAAEDQLITLGVQPIWHNGIRVRLSDVLQSSVSSAAPKEQQRLLKEVLEDFTKTNLKKVNPTTRAIIHGLSAQRTMNMADITMNLSKYAVKAKEDVAANYMGRSRVAAESSIIRSSVEHAIKMGMTGKEATAIKELVENVVDIDKLPADKWLIETSRALQAASKDGRATPELISAFNKAVAESLGLSRASLQTKISGSRVADAIMTRMTTWWGKGDLWKHAQSVFTWGERNAEMRAATMRYFANNYSKDEHKAAWKLLTGNGENTNMRVAQVAEFMQKYMDNVLLTPQNSGFKLANAKTASLSVAERSMMNMNDVNRHLVNMNGSAKSFQFTNKRQVTDVYKRKHRFHEGNDWMKSWILATPDDPIKFIYDIDLALERTTKEYAFLDDFVDKFGSLTKDATHDFAMSLPRTEGFYVPKEVGQQMFRIMDSIDKGQWKPNSSFGKFYRKSLRVWKTGVTIYLPSHHIRNGIGDMFLMWNAGHSNPYAFIWSKRIMASQRTRYTQAMKAGDFDTLNELTDPLAGRIAATGPQDVILRHKNTKITADQLYTGAFQRGLLLDANVLEDIFGETTIKMKPLGGKVHGAATKAAELREHYIRLAHFTSAVNKGIKKGRKDISELMDEAAFEVKKWHPDGRDLTQFEQKYMRSIVPFYSWIRKSTPLLFESLLTRPSKILSYPRGMVALQQSLGIDATMYDPFPDDQLFPEWIRSWGVGPIGDPQSDNSISKWWGLLGTNTIGLDGQPTGYTMINPSNPFLDAGQQFLGFGPKDTAAGVYESITPFAKVPIDLGKNSDFTGAPITQDEGGKGVINFLLKQIPFLSPVQRVTDYGEEPRDGVENPALDMQALIQILTATGVIGTGPYEKSAEFELKDMLRARQK